MGKSIIDYKSLYKVKNVANVGIAKYEGQFIVIGFSQREGVDYEKTFALVVMCTSIMSIMSLASVIDKHLYHIDVKTTFLNGLIKEEVYINSLRGFEVHGHEVHVCRLEALYGLK